MTVALSTINLLYNFIIDRSEEINCECWLASFVVSLRVNS